jgi:pimeloyl-ACP methyl ester carboxylesterase
MKTILFLHGSAGSGRNFKYLKQELPEFHHISFDLIGFGDSKKPNVVYDVKLFLQDIITKSGSQKIDYVIGHSLGAILAKEYASSNPISKVFLINYPMNKDSILHKNFNRMFAEGKFIAKIACWTKVVWKYTLYPFAFIFYNKYFSSFQDYFKHSNHSESSALNEVILPDNVGTIQKIKNQAIFISGDNDTFVNSKILKNYKSYTIKNMGHSFFNHEHEIAAIVRKNVTS